MGDPAEEFFAGHPDALAVFRKVRAVVKTLGPFEVRVTKSQVALRRKRGFAFVWMPGQYLRHPAADVVLSIALGRPLSSERFKEVAHPAPNRWMHHLEVHDVADIDDEVEGWLAEAATTAG
jgi:hypothetical protein